MKTRFQCFYSKMYVLIVVLLCTLYSMDSLAFAFMYLSMDFIVFIVFYFVDTLAPIVIYCDSLCSIDHKAAINLNLNLIMQQWMAVSARSGLWR